MTWKLSPTSFVDVAAQLLAIKDGLLLSERQDEQQHGRQRLERSVSVEYEALNQSTISTGWIIYNYDRENKNADAILQQLNENYDVTYYALIPITDKYISNF